MAGYGRGERAGTNGAYDSDYDEWPGLKAPLWFGTEAMEDERRVSFWLLFDSFGERDGICQM
jgi:hypothetical protein